MIKLKIESNGNQTLTKVCNHCGCYMEALQVEDIMVKQNTTLTIRDKDGNEITRKEIPSDLTDCKCETCND